MKVTIDNLDGLGPIDYSGALAVSKALEVERTLNAPSLCRFGLALTNAGLRLPLRNARVMVSCDDGTMLFTGYLPCEPVRLLGCERLCQANFGGRIVFQVSEVGQDLRISEFETAAPVQTASIR